MKSEPTMQDPAVRVYTRLLRQLHTLIDQGSDESPEGDQLRDEMDPLWYAMSESEREEMKALSAALNAQRVDGSAQLGGRG